MQNRAMSPLSQHVVKTLFGASIRVRGDLAKRDPDAQQYRPDRRQE